MASMKNKIEQLIGKEIYVATGESSVICLLKPYPGSKVSKIISVEDDYFELDDGRIFAISVVAQINPIP